MCRPTATARHTPSTSRVQPTITIGRRAATHPSDANGPNAGPHPLHANMPIEDGRADLLLFTARNTVAPDPALACDGSITRPRTGRPIERPTTLRIHSTLPAASHMHCPEDQATRQSSAHTRLYVYPIKLRRRNGLPTRARADAHDAPYASQRVGHAGGAARAPAGLIVRARARSKRSRGQSHDADATPRLGAGRGPLRAGACALCPHARRWRRWPGLGVACERAWEWDERGLFGRAVLRGLRSTGRLPSTDPPRPSSRLCASWAEGSIDHGAFRVNVLDVDARLSLRHDAARCPIRRYESAIAQLWPAMTHDARTPSHVAELLSTG